MDAVTGRAEVTERITEEQRRLLNAVCGDLARQVKWHGNNLHRDDWRHLLSGTALGWRMVPGINLGNGAPGFVFLGGSSLSLSKQQATDAIQMGLQIGDHPSEQGLDCKPVTWSRAVLMGIGFSPQDFNGE